MIAISIILVWYTLPTMYDMLIYPIKILTSLNPLNMILDLNPSEIFNNLTQNEMFMYSMKILTNLQPINMILDLNPIEIFNNLTQTSNISFFHTPRSRYTLPNISNIYNRTSDTDYHILNKSSIGNFLSYLSPFHLLIDMITKQSNLH
jgi:hypothetical protein